MNAPAAPPAAEPRDVLDFWREAGPERWFKKDDAFDQAMTDRFLTLHGEASAGALDPWSDEADGSLALILVLDQFSRNIYRGTPQAYAQDPQALALSQEGVAAGALLDLREEEERTFLLMPYMHSESRLVHVQAESLFRQFTPPGNHEFELRHKAIIDRFARYPHRNGILGRTSSDAEIEFLRQPGSGF